ncbi:Uncharacterised protein [Mycobacteroides abscessus subsp. abscessus]|nr:Uncharacterised protein [Mycobacteroides abscessus subsp. abscessus]
MSAPAMPVSSPACPASSPSSCAVCSATRAVHRLAASASSAATPGTQSNGVNASEVCWNSWRASVIRLVARAVDSDACPTLAPMAPLRVAMLLSAWPAMPANCPRA